ncbi:hypothetical protein BCV69DRAFT_251053 [Microstroma glucosiphilum]|uniref:37S ribosomal protein mrp10, mitochondrial n=1 Tax=Pseudomicrostroma glucosiphilum TaxID=1684307 RepID=A0A316U460_9BASI|nr:hypothetical protein BCV69DRAFT_251053 [Pseudomicrostroma glucosiphilum]PWN19554.1 hypothetical protein BCV69DRAFT_251053 [Pseudomicrostroma glucosiphilum]
MRIHQLKVRPKKSLLSAPCSAELAALLACWASTDRLGTHGACANAMRGLEECMRRAATAPRAKARPAINYHLAKWGKQL